MTGDELPEPDHVARYVGAGRIDQEGRIVGNAFIGSIDNPRPSCHWLEVFGLNKGQQIEEVRRRSRLRPGARAVFAILNVGRTKAFIRDEVNQVLGFIHAPLEADATHVDDPSHSVITGTPTGDDPAAEFIGDLIGQTIVGRFPARSQPG